MRGVGRQAQLAEDGDGLAGESLVELDNIKIGRGEAEPGTEFQGRGCGTHPHDARRNARGGAAQDAGNGREAVLSGGGLGCDDEGGGAIVDAGGVARGHRALRKKRPQSGQGFGGGAGAGVLVGGDEDGVALFLRDRDGGDFAGKTAVLLRGGSALLAINGEEILVLTRDTVFAGDVLAGFRHRVGAVELLHARVDEPPADGGVVDFGLPRERRFSLGHHERRPAHGFGAAGNDEVGLARLDGARGRDDRIHSRAAKAIHGRAGNADRETREQQAHAGDIAVVLAGLIGTAEDDVIHRVPIEGAIAGAERHERDGAEIVGAHGGKRPTETAYGGADIVADEGIAHGHSSGTTRSPTVAGTTSSAPVTACSSSMLMAGSFSRRTKRAPSMSMTARLV